MYPAISALTAQVAVLPGQRVEVWQVQFNYQGPARRLVCGWALKPRTGFFGTDWLNGMNTIPSARAFSAPFSLPNTPQVTLYLLEAGIDISAFGFAMPASGSYMLEGGGVGSISKGSVDTWTWLVDVSFIESGQLLLTPINMMHESNLLRRIGGSTGLLDTDSGPINLLELPAVGSDLQLGYRLGG